ncbi:MarR family transcriptional regulator [Oceanobacillus luteolus]|uniref:MarR family winged helix-turn-helix transcriptional regulator n=1 Tax=Oceanobacillus luteolus TaxID=1274358 RepID=UPI00203FE750|nr:winged helix DNA-binding protein [Oceanobacillus luteolus]MCM3740434.1 MarR family transcriptional regulator [Oceanobacillus luteolus]
MRETLFHQQLQFTRSFKKKLNEKLSTVGLFHSQWLLIYCMKKQQPVTLVEISNYLDVEKPTISRTVKRLEEQGLIEEVPSLDKREKRMHLTRKGEESYEEAQRIVTHFETGLMKEISDQDIETTLRTIQSLREKLYEEEIN